MGWRYVPGTTGSGSVSDSSCQSIARCAVPSAQTTREQSCAPSSVDASLQTSTTSEKSGADESTSSQQASHVNHSAAPLEGATLSQTCGLELLRQLDESWRRSYSSRTSSEDQSSAHAQTCEQSAIHPCSGCSALRWWEPLIDGSGGSLLATPTATANQTAPSMQKHPGCRAFVALFGAEPILEKTYEWLMGLPPGWTDLGLAETASYQQWRRMHSSLLRAVLSRGAEHDD